MDMTLPQILANAVTGVCQQINVEPSVIDTGSIGSACNFTLNQQGLLSGLTATVPGLEGKPIESVENACASGGQELLSATRRCATGKARWTASSSARSWDTIRIPTSGPAKFLSSRTCLQKSCSATYRCMAPAKATWRRLP